MTLREFGGISYTMQEKLYGAPVRLNIPSGKLAPFAGGTIGYLFEPETKEELYGAVRALNSKGKKYHIAGALTNTLISSGGIENLVSTKKINYIYFRGNMLIAGAGASLGKIARAALENGLSGLEPLSGIPGTVGGAAAMNAGAFGAEIGDYVTEIEVLSGDSVIRTLPTFSYRKADFLGEAIGEVVLSLNFSEVSSAELIQKYRSERLKKQPQERSLGSVWKSVKGVPAAVYIEKLNLKGTRAGGAELSTKHCNFIVNKGGATTADFLKLAATVEQAAKEKLGIELEREIKILAD
ncbi:MAG TPA: FAD-binding protein [Eubacteriales bacterium]|nr:FAD-binding protein [Clostridia bacterium]HRR89784.1 FAD-binding protein [Eubacteriales bacterium]HRU84470.1 FAD-binding protein [Eubacteriales bacterium]